MIKLKDFRRIVLLIAISLLLQIEVLEAFLIPSSFSSKLTHNIRLNPYRRPLAPLKSTDQPLINGNIQFDEVRLILAGSNGEPDEMIGIVSIDDALEKAEELELDLVCINENADPPVCKIIDYGKYRYEIEKRKKENMKKQAKAGDLKEIKMSYHIEQHDFDVRIRQIKKFVADGDRVSEFVFPPFLPRSYCF